MQLLETTYEAETGNFDPEQIFESGQCFRWKEDEEGYYTGIASGRALRIKKLDENDENGRSRLIMHGTDEEGFQSFWHDYFDLGRDYSEITKKLSELDPVMATAVAFGKGLRILRQEFWETLASFILSANNMIPRISASIEVLSSAFGEPVVWQKGWYAFPDFNKLDRAGTDGISICRGGFRCKYLSCAAEMLSKGIIDEGTLRKKSTEDARRELMTIPGVGRKVADCVLLYSGIAFDVFPVDVWVKRVMEILYFRREAAIREIHEFALNYFGELAGFAQLYLFYYARKNRIGK